jgi:hypothetical protein
MFLISTKTIEPSIGFIVNQLQNLKNFGIIKIMNKGANGI